MIHIYINYPNPVIRIHANPDCGSIMSHENANTRLRELENPIDAIRLLDDIRNQLIPFGSQAEHNDLWVSFEGTLEDTRFLATHLQGAMRLNYNVHNGFPILEHCGA